jgi:group I intron endonuclease
MQTRPYGVVYRITNLVNGKVYHGQTVNQKERQSHHFRIDSHCVALRNAIKKYGRNSFLFEVVKTASSKQELDQLEISLVETSLSPRGYNIKSGGANGKPSKKTRQKMSESGKLAQNRPEVRARNSLGVKRAWATESLEKRAIRLAAMKKAQNDPEFLERRRAITKEVHTRPGQKQLRSLALKNSWASLSKEEREARVRASALGNLSEEAQQSRSRKLKETFAIPEVKARLIEAQRASFTPERRKVVSNNTKELWNRPGERERRGKAISEVHRSPEGKRKLAMRRRRGESLEAWASRVHNTLKET